jgi:hypothetical protein
MNLDSDLARSMPVQGNTSDNDTSNDITRDQSLPPETVTRPPSLITKQTDECTALTFTAMLDPLIRLADRLRPTQLILR